MIQKKSFCVTSIGDLVVDIVIKIPSLPVEADRHQMVQRIQIEPGGAGNFLIAGARLGLKMVSFGAVGADPYGEAMLDILAGEGVDIEKVECQRDGTTTTVFVMADKEGQHVYLGQYGVGPKVPFTECCKTAISKGDALQTWGYTLEEKRLARMMLDAMVYARLQGIMVFFDPGPQIVTTDPSLRAEALANCDAILLTEDEIPYFCEGMEGVEAGRNLLTKGPDLVCVKLGEKGCIIYTEEETVKHPGFPVAVRDTSAAGDSFDAAFIYAYLNGWEMAEVAAFANAMGAAKVQKFGSGRQVPTAAEVREVLNKFDVRVPF